jgi:uncharacterized protein involved in oxidation of intracellular sulfur
MDARGFADDELLEGAERSTMQALSEHKIHADKVLVF